MGTASTGMTSGYRNPPLGSDSSLEWATETTAIDAGVRTIGPRNVTCRICGVCAGVVAVAAVVVTLEVVTVVVVAAVACVEEATAAAATVVTGAAEGEEATTAVMAVEATTVGVTLTHPHQLPLT